MITINHDNADGGDDTGGDLIMTTMTTMTTHNHHDSPRPRPLQVP